MNIRLLFYIFLCLPLFLGITTPHAETSAELQAEVDGLVFEHYIDGINYGRANALGADALPYLEELLQDQEKKSFWVNIIVTMGFIESADALPPLMNFLENAEGEVDVETFRALLSVPYAVGCIASSGDQEALEYLAAMIDNPATSNTGWSFGNKDIGNVLAEQAIMGMAVSGRAEAKAKLTGLRMQSENAAMKGMTSRADQSRANTLNAAASIMDRIDRTSRAAILNPQSHRE